MIRISLITVCFNSAKTLSDSLASVATQTRPPCEHIMVDGDSSDGTQDILAGWHQHHLRWSSEPDHGIYDAMNKGLATAKGDVVGFLNADDLYADNLTLATVATAFTDPDIEAVFGNLVYVAQNDPNRIVRFWNSQHFTPAQFSYGIMPPHPTLYIRRSVLNRHGGFRLDLSMANDFEFCVRYFARHRIRCRHIPRVLVRMRLGGESNRSLRNIIHQNLCIQQALAWNGLMPHPLYPLLKAIDKGRQFLARPRP